MRVRGVLVAFAAMVLLASMFLAVHRGARGRELAEEISRLEDRHATADVRLAELATEIERLRSRTRVVHAAERLGLRLPNESELVILDLVSASAERRGASR